MLTATRLRLALVFLTSMIAISAHAQIAYSPNDPGVPILAFKLLVRSTQPVFAPGEPLKLEVACASLPEIASAEWQQRWNGACANVKVEIEEARLGGYMHGVGTMAWLQNKLHLCLLPPGESYEERNRLLYTKSEWQSITVPVERLSGLRGMLLVSATAVLRDEERQLTEESDLTVTAIASGANDDAEVDLGSDVLLDAAAVQSGDLDRSKQLADRLLGSPTKGALKMAVRLFDNTERTSPLWAVIESSPHQQAVLDLMRARLKDADLVPDYTLLLNLTGIKSRLDTPLEFYASERQPYTEYHADLEDASVAYFRSLLDLLVNSGTDPRSTRASAIRMIAASVAETDRCPLGTYGLSSTEAAAIQSRLSGR